MSTSARRIGAPSAAESGSRVNVHARRTRHNLWPWYERGSGGVWQALDTMLTLDVDSSPCDVARDAAAASSSGSRTIGEQHASALWSMTASSDFDMCLC